MKNETTDTFPPVRWFKRDAAASTAPLSVRATESATVIGEIPCRSEVECADIRTVTDERSASMTAQVIPFPRSERSSVKSADDVLAALLKAAHAKDVAAYKAAALELAQLAEKSALLPFAFTVAQRFTEEVEDAAHQA